MSGGGIVLNGECHEVDGLRVRTWREEPKLELRGRARRVTVTEVIVHETVTRDFVNAQVVKLTEQQTAVMVRVEGALVALRDAIMCMNAQAPRSAARLYERDEQASAED